MPGYGGSSPHTRGAREKINRKYGLDGIIPAYAGSTGWMFPGRRRCKDHPRIRGEHEPRPHRRHTKTGSSPHTRGAPVALGISAPPVGIIPAYAGSTCEGRLGWGVPWDHPRIRGEHADKQFAKPFFDGSSPHTRGAPCSGDDRFDLVGIIPAYAGST